MRFFRLMMLISGLVVSATGASAEIVERKVKANTLTAVGGIFAYGIQNCQQGAIPDAKVGTVPRNGTVVVRMHQTTLGKETNCPGQKITGPLFIYTPKRGFKGIDEFTIEYPFARAENQVPTTMSTTYRITVE